MDNKADDYLEDQKKNDPMKNYQNCSVQCCVVYDSCAQWYAHNTYEQFLKVSVDLGFGLYTSAKHAK